MIGKEEFRARIDVSRETFERLEALEALLGKWNSAINLVSPQTLSQVWSRHFLDSAQIFQIARNPHHWADLGSGGGFPGLIVAIMAHEMAPDMQISLVESDKRKSAFLSTSANSLGIKVTVHAQRIEAVAALSADILSARALAPLTDLLGLGARHIAPNGRYLFPKGGRWREELAVAQKNWNFEYTAHQSATNSEAVVLEIQGAERV